MKTAFVYLTDKRGYNLTEHAVAAAMVTQKTTTDLIIFCAGFEPEANSRLMTEATKKGFSLEFRQACQPAALVGRYVANGHHAHVTSTTLLKMNVLDTLSKEYERALYLDGDVLLMEAVDLESIDFEGAPIAAVYDIAKVGGLSTELDFYKNCADHNRSPHYFNAGVIAVDFARWDPSFIEKYNQEVRRHAVSCDYKTECSCEDQCAWNRAFERVWKRLPLNMNFQACAMFSQRWHYASVRHYVGKTKFIPFKAWRNDEKDIDLLNKARKILGLHTFGMVGTRWIRALNVVRNRNQTKVVCEAIDRVETMYSEKM
jgi:lipopolysaccharide biosynthesis glycosyltransferase